MKFLGTIMLMLICILCAAAFADAEAVPLETDGIYLFNVDQGAACLDSAPNPLVLEDIHPLPTMATRPITDTDKPIASITVNTERFLAPGAMTRHYAKLERVVLRE